ncbi:hypothetical protein NKH18_22750 [Streptomyces sp. M10(2022)]
MCGGRGRIESHAWPKICSTHVPARLDRPLVSTLVTLPLILVALFIGGLSAMACDSCNGAEADGFTRSFDTAWAVLTTGLLLSFAVLVVSWFLPWRQRQAATRMFLAALAPAVVFIAFVAFLGLVD